MNKLNLTELFNQEIRGIYDASFKMPEWVKELEEEDPDSLEDVHILAAEKWTKLLDSLEVRGVWSCFYNWNRKHKVFFLEEKGPQKVVTPTELFYVDEWRF